MDVVRTLCLRTQEMCRAIGKAKQSISKKIIANLVPGSPSPQDKAKYSLNLKVLTILAEIRPGDVKQHKARDWVM